MVLPPLLIKCLDGSVSSSYVSLCVCACPVAAVRPLGVCGAQSVSAVWFRFEANEQMQAWGKGGIGEGRLVFGFCRIHMCLTQVWLESLYL